MSVKHGLICENKCMVEGVTKEEFDAKVSGSTKELTDELVKRMLLISGGEVVPNVVGKYENNTSISVAPYIETRFATSHERMFKGATALNTFTNYDLENSASTITMYMNTSLANVPDMHMPNVTNAGSMFQHLITDVESPLVSVGNLYMPKATFIASIFSGCINLTSIGTITTGALTSLHQAFYNCKKLTQAEFDKLKLNTSDSFDASEMYYNGGAGHPKLNYSKANKLNGAFKLSEITEFDGGAPEFSDNRVGVNCSNMFELCDKLVSVKNFCIKVSEAKYMFRTCKLLEEIGPIDFSDATFDSNSFITCTSLKRMCDMSFNSGSVNSYLFRNCTSLTTFTDNPAAPEGKRWNLKSSINFGQNPLDRESILKVFNGLLPSSATITISSTTNGYLTEEDKAIATSKGWTVSVA